MDSNPGWRAPSRTSATRSPRSCGSDVGERDPQGIVGFNDLRNARGLQAVRVTRRAGLRLSKSHRTTVRTRDEQERFWASSCLRNGLIACLLR